MLRLEMLTLRPTKMLAKRTHLAIGDIIDVSANPYADWCVHGFHLGPTRFLIFTHTTTLFSAVAPARGITTRDALFRSFSEVIPAQLGRCGLGAVWDKFLAREMGVIRISPIPNRSIMGSMNELIYQSGYRLAEVPIEVVNRELVEVPMFAIKEVIPHRAFRALGS